MSRFLSGCRESKKPCFPKLTARFPWARAQASSAALKPLCSYICVADASQMNAFS